MREKEQAQSIINHISVAAVRQAAELSEYINTEIYYFAMIYALILATL